MSLFKSPLLREPMLRDPSPHAPVRSYRTGHLVGAADTRGYTRRYGRHHAPAAQPLPALPVAMLAQVGDAWVRSDYAHAA